LADVSTLLVEWYCKVKRDLPWRNTSDPYRIWVSEIMLQQTRAQAAIPYYERFLARFPTLEELAVASEDAVLAQWAGLGYYTRARNLRRAAQEIVAARGFPRAYEAIRALPGIGDYTAAAVASIAFGLPHAVVDGNVLRVVARVENDASDIGSPRTRERFRTVVEGWLDRRDPGQFNQAIMELGATVCLPRNPMCLVCPLAGTCQAREAGTAGQLPVKLRKTQPVQLEGVLLIVRRAGRVLLRRRDARESRMAGFWDLPTAEDLPDARIGEPFGTIRHTITHHHYTWTVVAASARAKGPEYGWFGPDEMGGIPLCTTARKGLRLAGVGWNGNES
jgi:A/G-specific adenine glycosylase